jgi:hypothetical protein
MIDINIYPFHYRAFSLNIISEFPVTGFERAVVQVPDVTIRHGKVPEFLSRVINRGLLFQSNENEFLFHVNGVAAYFIRNGNEIIVNPLGNVTNGEVSAFLIGTSFGALLHQRRLLPLHACSILFNNLCLVFTGISGAGKSTLAAALINQGGTLVADDISVIDFSADKPSVCPAFPQLKIWEDSLIHLGLSKAKLEPVRGELKKYYLPVSQFSLTSRSIDHIFVLNSHNRPEMEIKPLKGVEKFRALKRHTYLFSELPKTGLEQNHFMLANQLARKVPMSILTRPNGDFNTDRMIIHISDFMLTRLNG